MKVIDDVCRVTSTSSAIKAYLDSRLDSIIYKQTKKKNRIPKCWLET